MSCSMVVSKQDIGVCLRPDRPDSRLLLTIFALNAIMFGYLLLAKIENNETKTDNKVK